MKSLNGIENHEVIFKYDIDSLKRSKFESEKLSEKTQESFREDNCEQYFLRFSSFFKRQSRAVEMTKTLLQGRKAKATNRIIGSFETGM